ncbi:MAG TPA: hypothetical protein VNE71_08955, partial [Myxococcota bacterium]|nr:hypothetical protein [Myxococcota bacterium]
VAVAEAADGNFVYATYVIDGLLDGSTRELGSLPRGLTRYYEGFWKAISGAADGDWETWTELQLPVIELLAVAAEPVTPEWLANVTGRSPAEIQRRALRAWRRFLVEEEGAWRIVRATWSPATIDDF